MPRPPYLLIAFDVDPAAALPPQQVQQILADVRAGLPANTLEFRVEHQYLLEVAPSQAGETFEHVGMYLMLEEEQHGGALRWTVQLCRIDEIAP